MEVVERKDRDREPGQRISPQAGRHRAMLLFNPPIGLVITELRRGTGQGWHEHMHIHSLIFSGLLKANCHLTD